MKDYREYQGKFKEWAKTNEPQGLQECPRDFDLRIGDKVTYTNDYGVEFKGHTIVGFTNDHLLFKYGNCVYLDTDSYWYPVKPESLRKEASEISFEQLRESLPEEMARVKKIASTLKGLQEVISVFESHFSRKYKHGDNVIYEVARVNIIKNFKGEAKLI